MKTGLNKNGLKLTGTENSQANVCITAVEGHSSEVLGVILILVPTITTVSKLLTVMMVKTMRGEGRPTQLTK